MSPPSDNPADESSARILQLELREFHFSVRAMNCLKREGVTTVEELASFSAEAILKWHNAGTKTVAEYRAFLKRLGLGLKGEASFGEVDMALLAERSPPRTDPKLISLNAAPPEIRRTLVTQLDMLPFSTRARNALLSAGVSYVGELAQMRSKDLLAMKSSGRKTVKELEDWLSAHGLTFGMKIPDWSEADAGAIRNELNEEMEAAVREADRSLLASLGSEPDHLEPELQRVAKALEREPRNVDLLIDLWGWNGEPPKTLEAVGTKHGLTRERVRQIEARALKTLKRHKFDLPILSAAVGKLRRSVPDFHDALAQRIQDSGVAFTNFSPASICLAAEILNIKCPLEAFNIGDIQAFATKGMAAQFDRVRRLIRKKTSEQGCTSLQALAAELKIDSSELAQMVRLLASTGKVEWLDETQQWLYAPASLRNRLHNVCAKVLGVVKRVNLTELRRAVSKSRRLAMCPPQRVLAAFISHRGLADVRDGFAYPVAGAGLALPEGSVEAHMLAVIKKYGPVMDGEEFAERCIAEGINATSFYVYRVGSPVISALGRNVYCAVGADVPPGAVEAIIARRRTTPLVGEHGWTTKGRLWFGRELTRLVLVAGSIRMPSFVAELVQGEWKVILPDGAEFGHVTGRDVFIWSFRKPFSVLGAEPADFATFEFDLKRREVHVKVGGPDLFEAIQEPDGQIEDGEDADSGNEANTAIDA